MDVYILVRLGARHSMGVSSNLLDDKIGNRKLSVKGTSIFINVFLI